MATDADIRFLNVPAASPIDTLSAPVAGWFRDTFAGATMGQRLAWPAIVRGDNVLLAAPTGSGKTLAAFLPVLSELLGSEDRARISERLRVTCLYVAPLKALGRDVRKNVRHYLRGMESFLPAGTALPRVGLRTGDTSERVRRRQLDTPPEILLTTPESLALILCHGRAAEILAEVRWVIVDEVHALAASKRGADLALSLERLEHLVGRPLQRIGLSATCAPLRTAARYLVGGERPCSIAHVADDASLDITVEALPESGSFMADLAARLERSIAAVSTTLIFTNTRGLAEKLTWALRRQNTLRADKIAVHHSSLSQVRRRMVERRLKQGKLRVVVTSTSLELGIDIGSVENVILVHPPGDVGRLLQRLGRSGHQPCGVRRGLILTASTVNLLQATVIADSGRLGRLEPLPTPAPPLDVLCQQLLGLAISGSWTAEEAWQLVRRAVPFQALERRDFDGCLAYLSGKDHLGKDWLPARLAWHADCFTIADADTTRLIRRNLGTILSDETRTIRLVQPTLPGERPTSVVLGEVEDRFAQQLAPGDRFLLEGRCLEFKRLQRDALLVEEVSGRPRTPEWTGGGTGLSDDLAERIFLFRTEAAELLRRGRDALADCLRSDYGLGEHTVDALLAMFVWQDSISAIPNTDAVLIEHVSSGHSIDSYVHTPLARSANDALARVVVQRLARDWRINVAANVGNLGFVVSFPHGNAPSADGWRRLLQFDGFDAGLNCSLSDAPILRERFGRLALTSLMVLRNPVGGRRRVGGPDWAERRLFDLVRGHDPDFFLFRQAESEIRAEVCTAEPARRWLQRLPGMGIYVRTLGQPSPFAEGWAEPVFAAVGE